MRVLVAPDCFTGTLSARQAAEAIAEGWRRQAPADDLELCPLSDGGPGFLEVLQDGVGGELLAVTVPGPLGEDVPAGVLVTQGPDGPRTAYLESAQACGLHLVPPARRDPGATSTAGVGALLDAAREAGAQRIVVGLGGSGTNDAGAGMLGWLADHAGLVTDGRFTGRLGSGGAGLRGCGRSELTPLAGLRARWADVELVIASDVDAPLTGFHGASAGFAAQKGATPEQAQALDRALGDFAAAAVQACGLPQRLSGQPGAGAAGGLGFGLLLLGARRVAGSQAVLDSVGMAERLGRNDLVVTGEGCLDWQSLRGKVVAGVAHAALRTGTPVIVLAGQVVVGRRELSSIGVESAYPVARTPPEVRASLADPAGTLADRAQRVARTWSR
ncbi:MAG TPA: glycerate kinase [Kineosporiaceae bacterium]|nr:glycerate kinase [Kineosporiaceae bacterium]